MRHKKIVFDVVQYTRPGLLYFGLSSVPLAFRVPNLYNWLNTYQHCQPLTLNPIQLSILIRKSQVDNKGKDIVYFTMFMENINNYIIIKMPASTLHNFSEDKDMHYYLVNL